MVKGFKETEVGIIPNDWEIKPLGEITTIIRGASPRPKGDKRFYGGNVPRLMVEDVTRDGKYVTPIVDFLTDLGAKQSRPCAKGTLTVVCSGSPGIPSILNVDACIHDGFIGLTKIDKNYSTEYLYYILSSLKQKFNSSAVDGGVFINLTTTTLKGFNIVAPPTKEEQNAIAIALNDTDELIVGLEKLISKKRDIKQGVMQELLKPKQDWVEKTLGEVATLKARIGWQGLTTAEYRKAGDYYLITGTEFKNGFIDWESCFYVDEERYKQDKNIQVKEHDILVTKDGTIGKVALIRTCSIPATLNSGVFVIRPIDNSFHPEFFYYLLLSEIFSIFLSQLSAGSTINHLYQKDFVTFKFYTPNKIEEQKEIAQTLTDIDNEIQELENELAKYKLLKQGIMQRLLTGKIRLI